MSKLTSGELPIKIIECPRDAMQGIEHPIPTDLKIRYLNQLLAVGFDTLDFGSFVSPKAVPQMADTAEVLAGLDLEHTSTRLLAIVANLRGAEEACKHSEIHYLGYPFSISETFQIRNTRKTIVQSLNLVKEIQELCKLHDKELVVYLSMAFGNPYEDEWSTEILASWAGKMVDLGITTLSLADTVGSASPSQITPLFKQLIIRYPDCEWGAHFHATPQSRIAKIRAAYEGGCRRFDSALMGYGGCPFAKDELVGNISTESLLAFCEQEDLPTGLDSEEFARAAQIAVEVFG